MQPKSEAELLHSNRDLRMNDIIRPLGISIKWSLEKHYVENTAQDGCFRDPPFPLTLITNAISNLRSTVNNLCNLTGFLQQANLVFYNVKTLGQLL
jgi:hypothetical protein